MHQNRTSPRRGSEISIETNFAARLPRYLLVSHRARVMKYFIHSKSRFFCLSGMHTPMLQMHGSSSRDMHIQKREAYIMRSFKTCNVERG